MSSEFMTVYLELDGRSLYNKRIRELIFMHGGASVKLQQRLMKLSNGEIFYHSQLLTASDCSECAGMNPEWADNIAKALKKAQAFEKKSRPNWEKYAKDEDPAKNIEISLYVDYPGKYDAGIKELTKELENDLERYILDRLNMIDGINLTEEDYPVSVQIRNRVVA